MIVRRTIAGSVVALLLAVSSLAAACDLSCAFAVADTDCHLQESQPQRSADSGIAMNGMSMVGTAMPAMTKTENQAAISDISQTRAGHPTIGDMGPCERQSCDKNSFISVKTNRAGISPVHSVSVIAATAFARASRKFVRGAPDGVAANRPLGENPLRLSLRI